MAIPVSIPRATITMDEAMIMSWRKQEGEYVHKDETLFEMETDKVVVEVPSPADGFLLRIDVKQGPARVEQTVAWLGAIGETIAQGDELAGRAASPEKPVSALAPTQREAPAQGSGVAPASPAARRRARELGVSLAGMRGTGPGGRITEADVERAGWTS